MVTNTVTNGTLTLGFDAVGQFSVYLQSTPADFSNPATFRSGTCIATFQRTTVVMGTTLGASHGHGNLFASNVFSAQLINSQPFEFGGQQYNLADILGFGVTQFGTAGAVAFPPTPEYPVILPFSGSALAVGSA